MLEKCFFSGLKNVWKVVSTHRSAVPFIAIVHNRQSENSVGTNSLVLLQTLASINLPQDIYSYGGTQSKHYCVQHCCVQSVQSVFFCKSAGTKRWLNNTLDEPRIKWPLDSYVNNTMDLKVFLIRIHIFHHVLHSQLHMQMCIVHVICKA